MDENASAWLVDGRHLVPRHDVAEVHVEDRRHRHPPKGVHRRETHEGEAVEDVLDVALVEHEAARELPDLLEHGASPGLRLIITGREVPLVRRGRLV